MLTLSKIVIDFGIQIAMMYESDNIGKIMRKKQKVTCSPDIKGKFGLVTETFTVGAKSVKVIFTLMLITLIITFVLMKLVISISVRMARLILL